MMQINKDLGPRDQTKFTPVVYGQEVGGIQIYPEFVKPEIAESLGALAHSFFEAQPDTPTPNTNSTLVHSIYVESDCPDELEAVPISKKYSDCELAKSVALWVPILDRGMATTQTSVVHRYRKGATFRRHTDKQPTRAISLLGDATLNIPDLELPILLTPGTMFHTSNGAKHSVTNISDGPRYSLCLIDKPQDAGK